MEIMKKVVEKYGLYCLFYEKLFVGVNGLGKYNNWLMGIDDGMNFFEFGKFLYEN